MKPKPPKFKCGVSVGLLRCPYDKKGICTFDAGKGVKCVNRKPDPEPTNRMLSKAFAEIESHGLEVNTVFLPRKSGKRILRDLKEWGKKL